MTASVMRKSNAARVRERSEMKLSCNYRVRCKRRITRIPLAVFSRLCFTFFSASLARNSRFISAFCVYTRYTVVKMLSSISLHIYTYTAFIARPTKFYYFINFPGRHYKGRARDTRVRESLSPVLTDVAQFKCSTNI